MTDSAAGQAVDVHEDLNCLTGRSLYADDLVLPNQAYGVFVRSPWAHARISGLEPRAATACPGVLQVLTADDFAHFGNAPPGGCVQGGLGAPLTTRHPILAAGWVRYVGQAVALVVGDSVAAAKAGAAALAVHYERLPAPIDVACATGSPATLHPGAPDNVAFRWAEGDEAATAAAFARAAHVTRLHLRLPRVIRSPIEPRAANACYDADRDHCTLHANERDLRRAAWIPGARLWDIPGPWLRAGAAAGEAGSGVPVPDELGPEEWALLRASLQLGRPVKWTAEQGESFLTAIHDSDHLTEAALALDAQGQFLALQLRTTVNLGAYRSTPTGAAAARHDATGLAGPYAVPAVHCEVTGVFTATAPVSADAGTAEAIYVRERLVDVAAHELGLDPMVLRRRNFRRPTSRSVQAAPSDQDRLLDQVLVLADVVGFPARRAVSDARGRRRGLGLCCQADTGAVVCEAEVDPSTGAVVVDRVSAVSDFSAAIDPANAERQMHASLAQGLGQALMEQAVYDPHTGQLLTASYWGYALARAEDWPLYAVQLAKGRSGNGSPSTPAEGISGETLGAPAALINALCDALGVKDLPMPALPDRLWVAAQARDA